MPKPCGVCLHGFSADMEIEWTGHQQLMFLLESICAGLLLGAVFGIFNGVGHIRNRRGRVFLLDVLYFVLAAVITFFSSLVVMDGQLHPLLFIGILCGAVISYLLLGRFLSRLVCMTGRRITRIAAQSSLYMRKMRKNMAIIAKNAVKPIKNAIFFSKKT